MQIGEKLKRLRQMNELTQQELADRAELSKGFISQIERDLTSPSIATLVDILTCLGTDLKDFFADSEDTQIVFKKSDYFSKEDIEFGNNVEWVVPNAQKNQMEPIRLTLKSGGRTLIDQPHDGEEFGYVLKGTLKLYIGKESFKISRGESFYFVADRKHHVENTGNGEAILIWVSSPPSF